MIGFDSLGQARISWLIDFLFSTEKCYQHSITLIVESPISLEMSSFLVPNRRSIVHGLHSRRTHPEKIIVESDKILIQ